MTPARRTKNSTGVDLAYRQIVDEANDGILVIGKDGTVLYANPAARKYLGHSTAGPFLLRADEIFDTAGDTWQSWLSRPLAVDQFRDERTVRRIDGSSITAEIFRSNLSNEQTLILFHDITALKQEEQTRELRQQLYETIAENLPNSMTLIVDRQLRYLYCGGPELKRLGWSRDFLLGKRVRDIIPPEQVDIVEEYCRRSLNGETVTYQVQVAGSDYNTSSAPLSLAGEAVDRIIVIAQNVTPQMQAQRIRAESEERYRKIFENSHAVMLLIDAATGDILDANSAAIQFYGWPLAVLRSMHITDLDADLPHTTLANMLGPQMQPSSMFHVRHKTASGEIKDVEVYTGSILLRERTQLLSIVHDASARYRAEQALAESEARYRTLFEQAGDAIVLMDQFAIVDCNAKSLEFFKGDRESLVGRNIMDLLPDQQPGGIQSAEEVRIVVDRALKGEVPHCECVCCRLDGTRFDAEMTLSSFAVPEKAYVLALIRDVTQRNAIEHQLARSLEEKVTLLREIHHRVKNNMQVVSSLLNLQASVVQSQEARNALRDSQDRIRSMALIHEKLYGTTDLTAVTMDEYVHELISYLSRSYGRPEITITSNVQEIKLRVDKAIPCGLILNELLTNALKHAFPGDRHGAVSVGCMKEEDHVVVTVGDDGIGLPEGFDIRTSTSLGLLLVNILTEQLGGTLNVDRSAGTTFRVRFPL